MQDFITKTVAAAEGQPQRLLEMLRAVQQAYGYVPPDAVEFLSAQLGLPRGEISAVVEFYGFLSSSPQGVYRIVFSDSITDRMLGNQALFRLLADLLQVQPGVVSSDGLVSLDFTSCTGLCEQGPAALVNGWPLPALTEDKIARIAGLVKQRIPLLDWPGYLFEVNDYIRQPGLLLQNPIAPGQALQAWRERGAAAVLEELEVSGLRGRGGAGFKTALKWRLCAEEAGPERVVVCNADEGEPGTFKDRVLLRLYADQVFEGMTLCAAIIGARQGFLYLRGEYLFLLEPLRQILRSRRELGLLGENISGFGFDFDIEIRLGAGAYICGEESALIESLEGKPGVPRNRPPYPVARGYLQRPTVVNNVETFLAAAAIGVYGGAWFAAAGAGRSSGTKILSISGDCARPGIYEYAFGVEMAEILRDCGTEDVLCVQVGGPSGTLIDSSELQRKLSYEDLASGGSLMVFNRGRDVLGIVQNFTHFFAHESCGFCTPCRVGSRLLQNQLDKIINGHGSAGDVAELTGIAHLLKNYSHCGLGQTAANPVLHALQRFPELYESRLKKISYEPGFDLDAALEVARRMARRDDPAAHLAQTEEEAHD